MERDDELNFGVFKPVGHVVISFPRAEQVDAAVNELSGIGIAGESLRRFNDQAMLRRIDEDIARAGALAKVGQEYNLIVAHRELAARGYHFLVVHAPADRQAAQVAEVARRCGAERAQSYGRFIIEELIDRPGNLPQVGESPARGLDAQTPSGEEAEAAELKRREEGSA